MLLSCKEWMESAQDLFPGHSLLVKYIFFFLILWICASTLHSSYSFLELWALHVQHMKSNQSLWVDAKLYGSTWIWTCDAKSCHFTRHYLTLWISWTDFYGEQLIGLGFPLLLEEFGSKIFPWYWQLFSVNSGCCCWNGTASFCQKYSRKLSLQVKWHYIIRDKQVCFSIIQKMLHSKK